MKTQSFLPVFWLLTVFLVSLTCFSGEGDRGGYKWKQMANKNLGPLLMRLSANPEQDKYYMKQYHSIKNNSASQIMRNWYTHKRNANDYKYNEMQKYHKYAATMPQKSDVQAYKNKMMKNIDNKAEQEHKNFMKTQRKIHTERRAKFNNLKKGIMKLKPLAKGGKPSDTKQSPPPSGSSKGKKSRHDHDSPEVQDDRGQSMTIDAVDDSKKKKSGLEFTK